MASLANSSSMLAAADPTGIATCTVYNSLSFPTDAFMPIDITCE